MEVKEIVNPVERLFEVRGALEIENVLDAEGLPKLGDFHPDYPNRVCVEKQCRLEGDHWDVTCRYDIQQQWPTIRETEAECAVGEMVPARCESPVVEKWNSKQRFERQTYYKGAEGQEFWVRIT